MTRLLLFLPLFAVFGLPACTSPLATPSFAVEADEKAVHDAILVALRGRGWTVVDDSEGVVRAKLLIRTHQAEVDIHYSDRHVEFEHLRSVNLDERVRRDGRIMIHRRYVSWLRNLQADIESQLAFADSMSG